MSDDSGKKKLNQDESDSPTPGAVSVGTGGVALILASWAAYGTFFFWPAGPKFLGAALAFAFLMTGFAMVPKWMELPQSYRRFVQNHTVLVGGIVTLNTVFFLALFAKMA